MNEGEEDEEVEPPLQQGLRKNELFQAFVEIDSLVLLVQDLEVGGHQRQGTQNEQRAAELVRELEQEDGTWQIGSPVVKTSQADENQGSEEAGGRVWVEV